MSAFQCCVLYGSDVFLMTGFYVRIYPLLAYTVLLHKYLASLTESALLNVFVGAFPAAFLVALFEYGTYYYILKDDVRSVCQAGKWFWTGTFSVSWHLLCTMHLSYLPSNVVFVRLYRAHIVRMLLQILIMAVAIGMQIEND